VFDLFVSGGLPFLLDQPVKRVVQTRPIHATARFAWRNWSRRRYDLFL
jgi:hypothetical protein